MLSNKILIIDDDQLIVNSIQRSLMLENNDYEIISAGNGKKGLALYRKEGPVLVLLDLNMPVMGGVEFLKEIKLTPTTASAVIVLTCHTDEEYVEQCFDLGVSSFLRKPFNRYEFLGLVNNVIALKKVQHVLKEKCRDHKAARQQFSEEKNILLSAMMNRVKKSLIPIVSCTKELFEGQVSSEEERISKLREIQEASQSLVEVFENPSGDCT